MSLTISHEVTDAKGGWVVFGRGPQSDGTIHPGQQTYTPRPNKIPLNRNGMQNMRIGGAMSGEGMGGASRPASRANLQYV